MSIREYKEDEHPGGFIGFRVARTIGIQTDYKQKYFSVSEHGLAVAKSLAHEKDNEWKILANEVTLENKLNNKSRKSLSKNVIAEGLRAYIQTESKIREGVRKTYFVPCFLVKKIGAGKSSILFRIAKHGYPNAYGLAVKEYGKIHDLSANQILSLFARIPDKTLFTGYLLNNIRGRNHKLSKKTLSAILNNDKSAIVL